MLRLLLLAALLALGACSEPGRYPLGGGECRPGDPVRDMTVPNCPPGV